MFILPFRTRRRGMGSENAEARNFRRLSACAPRSSRSPDAQAFRAQLLICFAPHSRRHNVRLARLRFHGSRFPETTAGEFFPHLGDGTAGFKAAAKWCHAARTQRLQLLTPQRDEFVLILHFRDTAFRL
jgi:hypothetical protein